MLLLNYLFDDGGQSPECQSLSVFPGDDGAAHLDQNKFGLVDLIPGQDGLFAGEDAVVAAIAVGAEPLITQAGRNGRGGKEAGKLRAGKFGTDKAGKEALQKNKNVSGKRSFHFISFYYYLLGQIPEEVPPLGTLAGVLAIVGGRSRAQHEQRDGGFLLAAVVPERGEAAIQDHAVRLAANGIARGGVPGTMKRGGEVKQKSNYNKIGF